MSEPRKLRCYQYVDRPYTQVRALLRGQPLELLQKATTSAAARARSVAANLKVDLGGIEIGVNVRPHVVRIGDQEGVAGLSPVTCVQFSWEAARTPALFPLMRAELSLWPLSSTETQIEIEGAYEPPLGTLGNAIDAVVGHRIAEASVHRFLDDVVEQIRREIPKPAGG
jgi:hypothetical protein